MRLSILRASASSLILYAAPAFAEEAADRDDQTIVVTATRYAQDVSKAPAAVTVVTSEAIENRNVSRISDALIPIVC